MATNQCSRLEQRSVIKFLVGEKCKHVKFIEEYVMITEKNVFVKIMFINGPNNKLASTNQGGKDYRVETH